MTNFLLSVNIKSTKEQKTNKKQGGTVQWEHKTTTKKHLRMAVFIIWNSKKDKRIKSNTNRTKNLTGRVHKPERIKILKSDFKNEKRTSAPREKAEFKKSPTQSRLDDL